MLDEPGLTKQGEPNKVQSGAGSKVGAEGWLRLDNTPQGPFHAAPVFLNNI